MGDRLEGDDPRVLVLVLIGEALGLREASPGLIVRAARVERSLSTVGFGEVPARFPDFGGRRAHATEIAIAAAAIAGVKVRRICAKEYDTGSVAGTIDFPAVADNCFTESILPRDLDRGFLGTSLALRSGGG